MVFYKITEWHNNFVFVYQHTFTIMSLKKKIFWKTATVNVYVFAINWIKQI